MVKKEEIKLISFGIIASAYMMMFYDLIQEFAKSPIDSEVVIIKFVAGIISMLIGIGPCRNHANFDPIVTNSN